MRQVNRQTGGKPTRRAALRALAGGVLSGTAATVLGRLGGTPRAAAGSAELTSGPAPSRQVAGPAAPADASAVLASAIDQYQTMTATRYQHHDVEDAGAGTYFYDCVGMVTYTLRQGAPSATEALLADLHIRPGFVPNPPHYVDWFTAIQQEPSQFWQPVPRVADLLPGDVIAWNLELRNGGEGPLGHAVVAAGPLLQLSDGSYALLVYDSTATPHGPNDTRRTDGRNQIGPNGLPSGLGRGTIRLFADSVTGAPAGVGWTAGSAATVTPLAIGRALPG